MNEPTKSISDLQLKKDKVLAVDGDTLAYRTAAVCETHFEGAAYPIILSTLKEIVAETGVTNLRIYLSGKSNFRYNLAKTKPYKGNRTTMVKPQYLQSTRDHLIEAYNAFVVEGFEADDAIATDMTVNGAIHCGVDKDILQIPGLHYNYVKKEWIEISPEEAELTLYRQILMGDSSDNIPGLPRVGEKKAFDAIQCVETAYDDCLAMYEQVVRMSLPGVNHLEYMAEQIGLVKMRTDVPLIFVKPTDMLVSTCVMELDTAGFKAQEDGYIDTNTKQETVEKRSLKL